MKKNLTQIEQVIRQTCLDFDLRLYLLEWNSKGVTIYVDRKQGALHVKDLEQLSRQLSLVFAAEGWSDHLDLEVSTPGLDRKLKHQWHFVEALNKEVYVKTNEPLENQKVFRGVLTEVGTEFVSVIQDNKGWKIPFELIQQAHLVFKMHKQSKIHLKKKVYKQ